MKRILKIAGRVVGPVAALIILVVGLVAVGIILAPLTICFASVVGGWHCPDSGSEAARLAERETMKTAIMSMMVDKYLSRVAASVSEQGGEKIRNTGNQFHDTISLRGYIRQAATQFCYRWDADGRITFQYDVDNNDNCAIDAEQLFP